MSVNTGSEASQETASSIDIKFRFVETTVRLTVDGLRQRTQAVAEIPGLADLA